MQVLRVDGDQYLQVPKLKLKLSVCFQIKYDDVIIVDLD